MVSWFDFDHFVVGDSPTLARLPALKPKLQQLRVAPVEKVPTTTVSAHSPETTTVLVSTTSPSVDDYDIDSSTELSTEEPTTLPLLDVDDDFVLTTEQTSESGEETSTSTESISSSTEEVSSSKEETTTLISSIAPSTSTLRNVGNRRPVKLVTFTEDDMIDQAQLDMSHSTFKKNIRPDRGKGFSKEIFYCFIHCSCNKEKS